MNQTNSNRNKYKNNKKLVTTWVFAFCTCKSFKKKSNKKKKLFLKIASSRLFFSCNASSQQELLEILENGSELSQILDYRQSLTETVNQWCSWKIDVRLITHKLYFLVGL